MELKSILLFIAVSVNLPHFSYSLERFENISDCRYSPPRPSYVIGYPHQLIIICGKADNTSNIFRKYDIYCTNRANYRENPSYERIREINFENCLLRNINNDFFKNFTQLEQFDISDVDLVSISLKETSCSSFLSVFNASHNQLSGLEASNLFTSIKSLVTLDVSYNTIKHIGSSDFIGAGNLTALNISHNNLVEIPARLFIEAKKLNLADFSANKIERVHQDAFIDAKNLTSLNLSNNRLKLLEDHLFDSLTNLKYLNLSYNPIENLKIDALAYLTNLEHLDLKQANISSIVLGTFSFQPKLISLDLSDNRLKWLDFGHFLPALRYLTSLRLAGNQLQELLGFKNSLFPQLSSLDIKNNQFTCEYLKSFMDSVSWKKIDIPVDPNAIDRQKPSIRGINCETTYFNVIGQGVNYY